MKGCQWCMNGECWMHDSLWKKGSKGDKGGKGWQKGGDVWQKGGDFGKGGGKGGYSDSYSKGGYSDYDGNHGGSDDAEPSITEVMEAMKLIKMMKAQGAWSGGGQSKGHENSGGKGILVPMMSEFSYDKGKGKSKGKDKDKGKGKYGKGKAPSTTVDGIQIKIVADSLAWKSRLLQAYGQTFKEPPRKDKSVVFTTAEEGDGWVCSITCDKFETVYGCEGIAASAKQAEENASMVLMRSEFPAFFKSAPQNAKDAGEDLTGESRVPKAASPAYVPYVLWGAKPTNKGAEKGKGKKGKGKEGKERRPYTDANGNSDGQDPKSQLNHSIRVVMNRPIVVGEIAYVVEDVDGSSRATCTINCTEDGPRSFPGDEIAGVTPTSKRQAEHSAAAVALEAYKAEIEAAMPVFLATKEVRKAQKAEKDAARDAENAEKAARGEPIDEGPPERKRARKQP